ncbi:MAG: serine hydrolase [Acidimicrobiales bacterium]
MDERHVSGHCDDRFAEVGEEFVRNLTERGDVGASVAVTVGGESVVDLWGGWMDADRTRAWEKATLCVAMSSTKGATSLCAPSWRRPASSISTVRWASGPPASRWSTPPTGPSATAAGATTSG